MNILRAEPGYFYPGGHQQTGACIHTINQSFPIVYNNLNMTNQHQPQPPTVPTNSPEERQRLVVRALLCDDYALRSQLQAETDWIGEDLMILTNLLDAAELPEEIATLAIELNTSICHKTFD
jgi:hypothetical protein